MKKEIPMPANPNPVDIGLIVPIITIKIMCINFGWCAGFVV